MSDTTSSEMNMRSAVGLLALLLLPLPVDAQQRPPIIDMHLHAMAADRQGPPPLPMCTPVPAFPAWDPAIPYGAMLVELMRAPPCADPVWSPRTDAKVMQQTIAAMRRRNVFGVLTGSPGRVAAWREAAPDLFIPALEFSPATHADITPDSVRRLVERRAVAVFGEVANQYPGIPPDDDRMMPYWALAEELDIPVGIHIGAGPPGAAALRPGYLARLSSALSLEPVLVRHPRLSVYIMHAGWPLLDDLLAVLYTHPQVHVDISFIVYALPRVEFYRYLRTIVEAGFANRVMFGSDQMVWPGVIERSIVVIEEAPFLSEEQKRDILYNNAARFLRLSEAEIARHHGRR
jgi:uncharacterized protein